MKKKFLLFAATCSLAAGSISAQCSGYNLDFDGTDDYVNTNLVLMGTDSGTVEAWIKPESISHDHTIAMRGWTTTNAATWFVVRSNGTVQLQHYNGSWHTVTSTTTLSTGTWYHVAATWGSNGMKMIINGCVEATNSFTGRGNTSGAGLTTTIGEWINQLNGNYGFNGVIDEVRIWDEQVNPIVIRNWMTRTLTSSHPNYTSGLTAYFKFDGATGGAGVATENEIGSTEGTLGQTSQTYHPSVSASTGMYELSSTYISAGSALDFDGTDDYVTTNLNLMNTSSGTVEAWINPGTTTPSSVGSVIVGRPWTTTNMGTWLAYRSTGKVQMALYNQANSTWYIATSTTVLTPGKWYHVAGTWGAGGVKIYVNGCDEATEGNWTSGGESSNNNAVIGEWTDQLGGSYGYDGMIDEVRIWSAQVTTTNIQEWMNKSVTSSHANYANLTGYFKFDDNTGGAGAQTLNDASATEGTLGQIGQTYHPSWVGTSLAQINYTCPGMKIGLFPTDTDLEVENQLNIFPNPLSGTGNLNLVLIQNENVQVELFDLEGKLVKVIYSGNKSAGEHSISFETGALTRGVYFCKMTTSAGVKIKKLVLN